MEDEEIRHTLAILLLFVRSIIDMQLDNMREHLVTGEDGESYQKLLDMSPSMQIGAVEACLAMIRQDKPDRVLSSVREILNTIQNIAERSMEREANE